MASSFFLLIVSLLIIHITSVASKKVSPQLILEEGYTVSTVLDGNKLNINPFSVLPRPGNNDLIILDSSNSVFYAVPFPLSIDSKVNRFSGSGNVIGGFQDGDLGSAMFDRPRSFTIDLKGNIYVADRNNHAIRKISKSGVTTIAGGYSRKPGHDDGPAQNATFSDDFDIVFVPERCVLLISDHGNRLIREMNLKQEDCGKAPRFGLGSTWIWALGLGVSCLLGLGFWFAARQFVNYRTGSLRASPVQRDMEALPNVSGETNSDNLLRHQKRNC